MAPGTAVRPGSSSIMPEAFQGPGGLFEPELWLSVVTPADPRTRWE